MVRECDGWMLEIVETGESACDRKRNLTKGLFSNGIKNACKLKFLLPIFGTCIFFLGKNILGKKVLSKIIECKNFRR
jgi:hypothetical protein